MQNKQTKLLVESWRAFLKEEAAAGEKPSLRAAQALDQTLKEKDYVAFVNKLKELAGNPEFQKALNYGQKDGKPEDEKVALNAMSPKVTALRPTQNEIDMNGSLKFAVGSVKNLLGLLQDGEKSPGGNPIVTGAGGTIVLDGHHRWSQVYCVNPNATIKAIDLQVPGAKPMDYLKIMQLAIASNLKKVPVQSVKGTNLLDPSLTRQQLAKWILNNTPQEVLKECANENSELSKAIKQKLKSSTGGAEFDKVQEASFKSQNKFPIQRGGNKEAGAFQKGANLLTQLIFGNIAIMRKTSQPVEGAPKRDFMPQTDDATNWKSIAAGGQLNFKEPTAGITEAKIKQIVREEINKIKR